MESVRLQIGYTLDNLLDVTDRLLIESITTQGSETKSLTVNIEREEQTFERVVSDMSFALSNLDGVVTKLFKDTLDSVLWYGSKWYCIFSVGGKIRFRGRMQLNSNAIRPRSEFVEFTAFSLTKDLWERMKNTRVTNPKGTQNENDNFDVITLNQVIERELLTDTYSDIIDNYYVSGNLGTTPIRGWLDTQPTRFVSTLSANGTELIIGTGDFKHKLSVGYRIYFLGNLGFTNPALTLQYTVTVVDNAYQFRIPFTGTINSNPAGIQGMKVVPITNTQGNHEGRFRDLDPLLTHHELFTSIMFKNNAEMYVDDETGLLRVAPRNEVNDVVTTNIDDILCSDPEPLINLVDDEKFDYIKIPFQTPEAIPPQITALANGHVYSVVPGIYSWGITYVGIISGLEIESQLSALTDVTLLDFVSPSDPGGWKIVLTIPTGGQFVTKRRLYRQSYYGHDNPQPYGLPRLAVEISDNTTTSIQDTWNGVGDRQSPPKANSTPELYLSYDEVQGTWSAAIINDQDGTNQPQGRILSLDQYMRLRFIDEAGNVKPFSIYDILAFFVEGRDPFNYNFIGNVQTTWIDMLRTRRKLSANLIGADYQIGQPIESTTGFLLNDRTIDRRYRIKKASVEMFSEESTIVAKSI